MARLRGICVGAGYFGRFHYDAWTRIDDVEIVCICEMDREKATAMAEEFGIGQIRTDAAQALDEFSPDFIDIITPPASHLDLVRVAAERGVNIICQKPLAPTFETAQEIVETVQRAGVRFMVHENFRFQPWHREIRSLLQAGTIGQRIHTLTFRSRMGDGWGEDAYLGRQPYFRDMPRLLVFENGVHYIDTFRFLAGEIDGVYANLRRLNPVIQGEDCGLLLFEFASGALGVWDANRYNECNDCDPRFTFGEYLIEGDAGSIRLYLDGRLTVQPLGQPEQEHSYFRERRAFSGDCVYYTQRHFVHCMKEDTPFETGGDEYLKTLRVQEAVYRSAELAQPVRGLGS
jgi:predicted dehydrogenase